MKILLSAYACEPSRGSEPAVGWGWANELARAGHDVWVLTRENNRAAIENYHRGQCIQPNLHFIYYDLPGWAKWWKKGRRGVHLYYLLWQIGAYRSAKCIHAQTPFQLVHHVTFVSARQPSFMGYLGIPFIFGPAAGGEQIPWKLRSGCGWYGWMEELVRDVANYIVRFDPTMLATFSRADSIFLANEETRRLLPRRFREKSEIGLAIALEKVVTCEKEARSVNAGGLRVLFVGRLVNFKGVHLAIAALSQVMQVHPDTRLTVVGQGPMRQRLANLANKLRVHECIDWMPWVSQDKLGEIYRQHDIFLFPSLRDSGGLVVLEAMAHGLPVICLDLAGPGEIGRTGGAIAIPVKNLTEKQVIQLMAKAIHDLASDPMLRATVAEAGRKTATTFSWEAVVRRISSEYQAPSTTVDTVGSGS